MLRRIIGLRKFSTSTPYFAEHYQYPGNPSQQDFLDQLDPLGPPLVQDTTVYKPKQQIQFNRVGELLLYEGNPFRHKQIYFPYPYCLGPISVPFFSWLYFINPLQLPWQANNFFLFGTLVSWYPQFQYIWSLRYYINRLTLLRGGKVLKIQHSNIMGSRWNTWIFIDEINLISRDFKRLEPEKGLNVRLIDDEGNLVGETQIQVDNFVDIGRNMENHVLTLCKEGTVYHPEILSAVLKGFEIDTSNFRINTLHIERWFEPNNNIQMEKGRFKSASSRILAGNRLDKAFRSFGIKSKKSARLNVSTEGKKRVQLTPKIDDGNLLKVRSIYEENINPAFLKFTGMKKNGNFQQQPGFLSLKKLRQYPIRRTLQGFTERRGKEDKLQVRGSHLLVSNNL